MKSLSALGTAFLFVFLSVFIGLSQPIQRNYFTTNSNPTDPTFDNTTITNQLLFPTNAFPLSAGSTWNLTKHYQGILTNNDFAITAIGGLTNNMVNWGVLKFTNSAAAAHFCDLSSLPVTVIGTSSTNKLYVPAGKVGILSVSIWGNVGDSTNLVTALGQ